LAERQRRDRQPLFHARQLEFTGRVVQDEVLLGHPTEPIFERAQPLALRAPAEPLAVGFDASPQPALIRFQDRPRDLPGALQITFHRPTEKVVDGLEPSFDGGRRVIACLQRFQIRIPPHHQAVGGAPLKVFRPWRLTAALRWRALRQRCHRRKSFFTSHDYDDFLWLRCDFSGGVQMCKPATPATPR
jgi:hypothetical protein